LYRGTFYRVRKSGTGGGGCKEIGRGELLKADDQLVAMGKAGEGRVVEEDVEATGR